MGFTRRSMIQSLEPTPTSVVTTAVTGAASAVQADSATAFPTKPEVFVLVHGSFHGAWCWQKTIPHLESAGYLVHAITLTGLADRARYAGPSINLADHVADVAQFLEYEDLSNVVLVGHSYAGMVITGVAETQSERVKRLVYLDAFVPQDGQNALQFLDQSIVSLWESQIEAGNGWSIPPLPPSAFGVINPTDVAWMNARLTAMPLGTHRERIVAPTEAAAKMARTYIWCSTSGLLDSTAKRVQQDPSWDFRTLVTGHDAMITAPDLCSRELLRAAAL